jgi:hypothetical protein
MTLLDGSLHVFLVWLVRPRKFEADGYSINPHLNIGSSVKGDRKAARTMWRSFKHMVS